MVKVANLGIRNMVVFEVPSAFQVLCKISGRVEGEPNAIVLKGPDLNPGFFFHDFERGTFGPFETQKEALDCVPEEYVDLWEFFVQHIEVKL